jgi:hypothetical protein
MLYRITSGEILPIFSILCAQITEDLASLLSGLDVELLSSTLQVSAVHARVCIKENDTRFKEAMWIMNSLVSVLSGLTKSSRVKSAVGDVQTGCNTDFPNFHEDHNFADAFMSRAPSQNSESAGVYSPRVNNYGGGGPSSGMQPLEKPFEEFPGFGWLDGTAAGVESSSLSAFPYMAGIFDNFPEVHTEMDNTS